MVLTTRDNETPQGAAGWLAVMRVDGGTIQDLSLEGIVVSTLFDEDDDPETPLVDAYELKLVNAGFKVAKVEDNRTCASTAVVLHQLQKMVLQPSDAQRIARVTIDAVIPEGGCTPLVPSFENCLPRQRYANFVTFQGATLNLEVLSANVNICRKQFRRGDFNADGVRLERAAAGAVRLWRWSSK